MRYIFYPILSIIGFVWYSVVFWHERRTRVPATVAEFERIWREAGEQCRGDPIDQEMTAYLEADRIFGISGGAEEAQAYFRLKMREALGQPLHDA